MSESESVNEVMDVPYRHCEMIEGLIRLDISIQKISERTGISPQVILEERNANKESSIPEIETERLTELFLRERMKALYRVSPFLSSKSGAPQLEISQDEFRNIYDVLVESGELSYRLSRPEWAKDSKGPLREHLVK